LSSNETLIGTRVIATFERVPNLDLNFFASDGSMLPINESYVWVGMFEVDNSSGSAIKGNSQSQLDIVQTLDLQDPTLTWQEAVAYPYDSSGNQYKNVNYTTTFASGPTVMISYYHFPQAHTVTYSYIDTVRTLPPDTFKLSLTINNWQPKNMSNLFLVRLDSHALPYFYNLVHTLSGFVYTINFQVGSDIINQTINVVEVALVGSQVSNVTWYSNYQGIEYYPVLSTQEFQLFFYYPNFKGSLFYDPDFSVLVGGDNLEGTQSGDGGLSSTGTILLSVLVPVFVVGALLVVGVSIIVIIILMRSKRWGIRRQLDRVESVSLGHESTKQSVPE